MKGEVKGGCCESLGTVQDLACVWYSTLLNLLELRSHTGREGRERKKKTPQAPQFSNPDPDRPPGYHIGPELPLFSGKGWGGKSSERDTSGHFTPTRPDLALLFPL